jgi:hemolysin activation/secretion protein
VWLIRSCFPRVSLRDLLGGLSVGLVLSLPIGAVCAEGTRPPGLPPAVTTPQSVNPAAGPLNSPVAPRPAAASDFVLSGAPLNIPVAPPGAAAGGFVLAAVSIHGGTIFNSGELEPTYREYLGRRVGTEEIAQIVQAITAKYREAGFFLSHAVASPQPLAGGILDVRVIEGYIERVTITGRTPDLDPEVQPYTAGVIDERPLRLATLERTLTIVKDLPGLTYSPSITPVDEATGRYELVLSADAKLVSGWVAVDNRGAAYEGPWETEASAALTSLAVPFDELSMSFFTTPAKPRELIAGAVTYDAPIGSTGLRASLSAGRSSIHPGGYLASLDLQGVTDSFVGRLSYPLLRSRTQSLWISGSFNLVDSHEEVPGANVFDDHLRVFRADATYVVVDPWAGSTRAVAQISQGLNGLGASSTLSPNLSTPDGHAGFTKITSSITHERPIFGDLGIFFDLAGQKAWQPLLLSEQFSLGGSRFGRGYDPAELTGDDALAGTVELRYGHGVEWDILRSFQLYLFYDLGAVWNHGADSLLRRASLASAGGGVRLTLEQDFFVSLEIAKPLTLPLLPEFNKPVRVFARVSKAF